MAVDLFVRLDPSGCALLPANALEAEAMCELLQVGGEFKAVLTQPRNPGFHRKGMALMRYLFNLWEPVSEKQAGVPLRKDFDVFRDGLTVRAGFYTQVFNVDGGFQLKADSLSWGAMDNIKFERVFSRVIDVGIEMVGGAKHLTHEGIEQAIDHLVRFG